MARSVVKPVYGDVASAPLFERERELDALRAALDRLDQGAGSLVLVEGPAGIGKTRLLAEVSELAGRRHVLVRAGRAGFLERDVPFGVARQLLEAVVQRASEDERERLLAGAARHALIALGAERTDDLILTGDPYAPIHGLYWLLANLAEAQPIVLLIDDAHWSDVQTLRWLEYLGRRVADIPVAVVAAVRSGEPGTSEELDHVRTEADIIALSALSSDAVVELVAAQLYTAPSSEFSAACVEATGGNPFLISEVTRMLRADAMEAGPEAATTIAELGSSSVARYVLMRLGRFGQEAVALAKAISVLGEAPRLGHAAELAGIEEPQARELCDLLRRAEILAPGTPIEFVHPLVRAAIYQEESEEARSQAHRRAAELLHESGAAAGELAPHLLACVPAGDEWAVVRLREAAAEASSAGAPETAKVYLERALDEPPPANMEMAVLSELGIAIRATDPGLVPEPLITVAREAEDRKLRIRALWHLGFAAFSARDPEQSVRWNTALLAETAPDDRDRVLRIEAQRFVCEMFAGAPDRSSVKRIAALAADADPSTRGGSAVRQALGIARFLEGEPVTGVVELLASFPPNPFGREIAAPAASLMLPLSGRWDIPRPSVELSAEGALQVGLLPELVGTRLILAHIEHCAGELAEAEVDTHTAWSMIDDLAPGSYVGWVSRSHLIKLLLDRGDIEQAEEVAETVDLATSTRMLGLPQPVEARGHLRLAQGELEAGVSDLLATGELAEENRRLNPAFTPWRQEAAPALAALDRTAEAKELIEVAEERARRFGAAHVIGTVLRARGLIEQRKRGIETLRESVSALEEYGPPHELARSLVELGAALRRDGSRSESRGPLRRALELAARAGARGTEKRAREELAAAGSRPRSAFRTGVDSLTASELRTAKLAAEGLSNVEIAQRLFVTRKTVEKHLGNAYSKLEIAGREELAGALAAEGPTE